MSVQRVLHYPDETIDEVVGDGPYHLEQMNEHLFWIGLEGPDAEQVALWIAADAPIRITGGINGEESGTWPSGVEVEHHTSTLHAADRRGDHEFLEEEYAVKLLALLCREVDSTVPMERISPRVEQLLREAEKVCANWCNYDSWDALARALDESERAGDMTLPRAGEEPE